MSAEHLVHIAIGTPSCGWTAGDSLKRGHGQELRVRATGERRARSAGWEDLSPIPRRWTVRLPAWA
jgi:hypothetical protein